ncbi:putative toxin-antitoxin system, toxin component [Enterococcus faecalis 13-SD-W-01]|nr:putative toxin-antitoxin system, toxin component [Enterococcus faecalis 13-SD-W-01]
MDNIENLLKENGISVVITNTETKGFYLPSIKTIFLNHNLTELEQNKVLLHESRHALNHNELIVLYSKTIFRSKMEHDANKFMIEALLKNYINVFLLSVEQVDYMKFMDYYGIEYECEEYIKQLILNQVTSERYSNAM